MSKQLLRHARCATWEFSGLQMNGRPGFKMSVKQAQLLRTDVQKTNAPSICQTCHFVAQFYCLPHRIVVIGWPSVISWKSISNTTPQALIATGWRVTRASAGNRSGCHGVEHSTRAVGLHCFTMFYHILTHVAFRDSVLWSVYTS